MNRKSFISRRSVGVKSHSQSITRLDYHYSTPQGGVSTLFLKVSSTTSEILETTHTHSNVDDGREEKWVGLLDSNNSLS